MKFRLLSLGIALGILSCVQPATAASVINIQGWWHFDSPPGTGTNILLDSSGNHRDYQAAFVVPVQYTPPTNGPGAGALVSSEAPGGPLGTSGYTSSHSLRLGLEGDSDTFWNTGYVPPATNYCVEIWVRPQNLGGFPRDGNVPWVFSSGGFNCCTGPSGGACVRVEQSAGAGFFAAGIIVGQNSSQVLDFGPQVPIDTNNWMHLALVNTNGIVSFWTNGVLCAVNPNANETAPAGVMHLGTDGAYDAFDGYIAEERVFTFTNATDFSPTQMLYASSPRVSREPTSPTVWNSGAATIELGMSTDPCNTFQWYLYGTNATGANSPDLYLSSLALTDSGKFYACQVTNPCIVNGTTSSNGVLTVVAVNASNVSAYRNAINAESSLLAYFPGDSDSGTTLTDTKGGNNGTLQGGADFDGQTNRSFGNRALFIRHGNGDVAVPSNAAYEFAGGNGTVEAVVYLVSPVTPEPGTVATIFSAATADGTKIRYQLGVTVDGGTLVYTNDSGVKLSWPVTKSLLNRFAHVAFVFSGTTSVTAYVDGLSLGTQSQTGFGTGSVPCWIGFGPELGAIMFAAPSYWYGTIDELAVYGSALSASDIAVHNSKFLFGTNTSLPSIVSQSTSKTLYAGGSVTLFATVAGTPPLTYQWTSNGLAVAGATSPSYTLASTKIGSATYGMYVTNLYGWTNITPITMTFIAPPAGYASTVLGDHPVAFWRLADSSGPTAVDSAGGNDGTYNATGVTYGVAGPPGDSAKAAHFDGASGRVVVPFTPALNPAGPFTVEFWAAGTGGGNQGTISSMTTSLSGGYGFYFARNFGGYEFFTGAGGGLNMDTGEGGRPPLNQWTHVVGVCDGSANLYLYVNGYFVGTANTATTPFTANPSAPFYIGCRRDSTLFYNGAMSDVAFYNYALTPAQILNHSQVGQPQKLAITASTNVIADSNPNNPPLDGLNNGATWVASDSGRSGVMQFNPTLTTDNEISVFGYPQLSNANGTIMFWMKSSGVVPSGFNNGDDGCIMLWRMPGVMGGGMFIGLTQDGRIQLQGGYNQPHCDSGSVTVTNNAWHHVAMTFDLSSATIPDLILYIDGVNVATGAAAYDWMWPNQNFTLQIGADTMGYDAYWNDYTGELDDIRIYDTILSPSDISTAMGGGLLTTNVQLRYNFDTPPSGYVVTWPYGNLQTATSLNGPYSLPGGLTNTPPLATHSPFPISKSTANKLGKGFFRGDP
jgi:hypothetical protein